MTLNSENVEIYVPDVTPDVEALGRTTHLSIAAHQDDIEIMAYHGILECFQQPDRWFTGVVVTDGAGSPRSGAYADYTDEMMKEVRKGGAEAGAAQGRRRG